MVDWTLPLKMVPRPDVDGGTYSPAIYLRGMLAETREFIPLSTMKIDRDTQRHFVAQFDGGVRYMVTAERESSKPIYYTEIGQPWLPHHAPLVNVAGAKVYLHDRASNAIAELKRLERERVELLEGIQRDLAAMRQAEVDTAVAEALDQDLVEANPLWGMF